MKTGPNRKYTVEFRAAAVSHMFECGLSIAAIARSLEMSSKSLANWI
jgi:transposase